MVKRTDSCKGVPVLPRRFRRGTNRLRAPLAQAALPKMMSGCPLGQSTAPEGAVPPEAGTTRSQAASSPATERGTTPWLFSLLLSWPPDGSRLG